MVRDVYHSCPLGVVWCSCGLDVDVWCMVHPLHKLLGFVWRLLGHGFGFVNIVGFSAAVSAAFCMSCCSINLRFSSSFAFICMYFVFHI